MMFGMSTLLFIYVVINIVAILSGFVVVWGLLSAKRMDGWTAFF